MAVGIRHILHVKAARDSSCTSNDEYWNVICHELAKTSEATGQCFASYWDEHNLDAQRPCNISCYARVDKIIGSLPLLITQFSEFYLH